MIDKKTWFVKIGLIILFMGFIVEENVYGTYQVPVTLNSLGAAAKLSTSADLAIIINDETGTNTVVFSSSPTIDNLIHTGNSNFPGGIWSSAGNLAIGTITTTNAALTISSTGTGIKIFSTGGNNAKLHFWGTGRDGGYLFDNSGAFYLNSGDVNIKDFYIAVNGVDRFHITTAGKIGIGTETPSSQLTMTGAFQMTAQGAGAASFDANGILTSASDERKKDIQDNFTAGLPEILQINPILYKWKPETQLDTENIYAGFSAQNVKNYIPEAVGKDADGYYTLDTRPIIATLCNSIKTLQSELDEIKTKVGLEIINYKVTKTPDITKIIKTNRIQLKRTERLPGEETHEYVKDGTEVELITINQENAFDQIVIMDKYQDGISSKEEWQLINNVPVKVIIDSPIMKERPIGIKTVLKSDVILDPENGYFYQKTEVPKMVYKIKKDYTYDKDTGKYFRNETFEEAKTRRLKNGIDEY